MVNKNTPNLIKVQGRYMSIAPKKAYSVPYTTVIPSKPSLFRKLMDSPTSRSVMILVGIVVSVMVCIPATVTLFNNAVTVLFSN